MSEYTEFTKAELDEAREFYNAPDVLEQSDERLMPDKFKCVHMALRVLATVDARDAEIAALRGLLGEAAIRSRLHPIADLDLRRRIVAELGGSDEA